MSRRTQSELRAKRLASALKLKRRGKWREAIPLLRSLVDEDPSDSIIWFHLGTTFDSSGKMAEAIPCYLRALRLNPRHPHHYEMCLYLCSSYRKIGRTRAAGSWLKRAKQFDRDTPLERRLERLLVKSPLRVTKSK